MSNFSDTYRKKMMVNGSTRRARAYKQAQRDFDLYFENTLTRSECLIDGKPVQAVFQDQSQSNNKDLSDDKYIVVPNSVEIGVGSYVTWRDTQWLVFTEEYKTIPTHQQLKIKHINRTIKWLVDKDNKTICNHGKGWGAYVQNQTLYTLGVSFSGDHIPLANGKMSIYIKDTQETRAVKVGTRLLIAGQAYKIEFADYVSRTGLISWLLDEDTKNPETDNFELEIADYYKGTSDSEEKTDEKTSEPTKWNIEGEQRARLGRTYEYHLINLDENVGVSEWIIENIDDNKPFYVLEKDDKKISIRIKDDFRYVGQTFTIAAKVNNEIKNIAIKVIKKFG